MRNECQGVPVATDTAMGDETDEVAMMNDDQVVRDALDALVASYRAGDLVMPDGEQPRIFGHPDSLPASIGEVYGGMIVVRHVAAPIGNLYIFPKSHIDRIDADYRAMMEC